MTTLYSVDLIFCLYSCRGSTLLLTDKEVVAALFSRLPQIQVLGTRGPLVNSPHPTMTVFMLTYRDKTFSPPVFLKGRERPKRRPLLSSLTLPSLTASALSLARPNTITVTMRGSSINSSSSNSNSGGTWDTIPVETTIHPSSQLPVNPVRQTCLSHADHSTTPFTQQTQMSSNTSKYNSALMLDCMLSQI